MGPCVYFPYTNWGEDVVMAFKCISVNISYYHVECLGELGRAVVFFPLGILGIVMKYPSVCGGDPPMSRFTLFIYCDDVGLVPEASTYKERE